MQNGQEQYMERAIQLAGSGSGYTAPNPMVGAVLVYKDIIIGEGYHQRYGAAHAEVNCLNSVAPEQSTLIPKSTLYVTLEPCSHYGKTPPCSDLILDRKIPRVVIGTVDPFPKVSGAGIKKLSKAGVEVVTGIKETACRELNKRFFTFQEKQRPYLILKWAQSPDGFIAGLDKKPVRISNSYTDRVVHRWRSEEAAILVGTQTAISDNPRLNNRLWSGPSPERLVIDRKNVLPGDLHLLSDEAPALIFNSLFNKKKNNKEWIRLDASSDFLDQLTRTLYERDLQSVLIEGGAALLQSFIHKGLWDEARVITGMRRLGSGIAAPKLSGHALIHSEAVEGDEIAYYKPV